MSEQSAIFETDFAEVKESFLDSYPQAVRIGNRFIHRPWFEKASSSSNLFEIYKKSEKKMKPDYVMAESIHQESVNEPLARFFKHESVKQYNKLVLKEHEDIFSTIE